MKNQDNDNSQERNFITLPYADDFCLITTNKRTHQKLINEINNNINSMGMKLKPSKCRSFSLSRGSSKVVDFFIGESHLERGTKIPGQGNFLYREIF